MCSRIAEGTSILCLLLSLPSVLTPPKLSPTLFLSNQRRVVFSWTISAASSQTKSAPLILSILSCRLPLASIPLSSSHEYSRRSLDWYCLLLLFPPVSPIFSQKQLLFFKDQHLTFFLLLMMAYEIRRWREVRRWRNVVKREISRRSRCALHAFHSFFQFFP